MTEYFVHEKSIVRQIWNKSDTIMFIFAGAAAEFAIHRSVDWLYFTGKLPSDPIGRFFSTVVYARRIVFSKKKSALKAIDAIASIHKSVESSRGVNIPEWAYRDVLFMLVDYSIRSFELLERTMLQNEKQEVLEVFLRMGARMSISGLPRNFKEWSEMRIEQLNQNLEYSHHSIDLFDQYKKQLGCIRYTLLLQIQKMILPEHVSMHLGLKRNSSLTFAIAIYKVSRRVHLDHYLKALLLPRQYSKLFEALENPI